MTRSTRLSAGSLAVLICLSIGLAGCATSNSPSATDLCLNAFTDALPADEFTGAKVTETLEDGGSAVDIRGSYDLGTFACGLSEEPGGAVLHQAIVFYDNGNADTVVNNGEKQELLGR